MTRTDGGSESRGRLLRALLAAGLALVSFRCASSGARKPDKITLELLSTPKETLFEKGKGLIDKKKYEIGRKYLTFVFETYPNDPLGREALLMVADSFFRQGGTTGYTEARFRYRDYLNRYPGAPKRDYARYQFAVCYDREHEKPDRDQTTTREAIEQYRLLQREFPNSAYSVGANSRIKSLADLLAEHEFAVGYFYMRKGSPSAALSRFVSIEERFPDYGSRDKLFYYSGEVLGRLGRKEEANRYYSRLLEEFPASEWSKKARDRVPRTPPPTSASR